MGAGVFATAQIPAGTLVYVRDKLEIAISPRAYGRLDEVHRQLADKYSFIDERGRRVISWDNAKYVNHRCDCNTMSTGWGFEIALRDIAPGEEITDEYGLFNLDQSFHCSCGSATCRGMIREADFDVLWPIWDDRVRPALACIPQVAQPLWQFLDEPTHQHLEEHLAGSADYRSVYALRRVRPVRKPRRASRVLVHTMTAG